MRRPVPVMVLGSVAYTTLLFATSALFGTLIILFGWLPVRKLHGFARGWALTQMALLRILCGISYTVEGAENIPAGCHVSMWKHSSTWETIAQMVIFPPQSWVMKQEILWIPIVGWATRLLDPIAINRSAGATAVNQVVQKGKQRLAEGLWVLVFPEGTRVPVGTTRRYGISGALLASQAGCSVVPVAHDAGLYWRRRALFKRPGVIRVVIGAPITSAGRDAREINEQARAWIDDTVARLGA